MGYFAGVQDLRNLLSVASKLRSLAEDTILQDDKDLYLTAAAALEARAERLSSHLPEEPHDRGLEFLLHRPVNMLV
jgi:hypothetical protein